MTSNGRSRPAGYVPTLDGWRALSVLAVIVYHGTLKDSNALINHGQKGVLVFFAISGYLITLRLLDESASSGRISLKAFYVRRVFRIFPAAYLCLTVLILLSAAQIIRVHPAEALASLLFVRNVLPIAPEAQGWYTAHFWSLAVEEQFYLFWPFVMALGLRRAHWFSFALIVANGAWRALTNHYGATWMPAGAAQPPFDYIMWGCWWALLLTSPTWRERCRRVLSLPVWLALVAATAAAAQLKPTGVSSLLGALIALVVVGTVLRPETVVGRFLEWAPLRFIGRLSYGIYLWQQLFFVTYSFPPRSWAQRLPLNALLLLAVATLSYYLLEQPLMTLGRTMARRVSAPKPPTAALVDLQA